jgi:hypothetical protein
LIGWGLRQGTGHRVQDAQPRKGQEIIELVGHPPKEVPQRSLNHHAHSHRPTARPSPQSRLPPPPLRASALLGLPPSATGTNCSSTATVQRNRSVSGALVSRTAQRALQSRLTTSSALGLTVCHSSRVRRGSACCRARSSWANCRMRSEQSLGTRTVTSHSSCADKVEDWPSRISGLLQTTPGASPRTGRTGWGRGKLRWLRDQLSGDTYTGHDEPSAVAGRAGTTQFRVDVIDT